MVERPMLRQGEREKAEKWWEAGGARVCVRECERLLDTSASVNSYPEGGAKREGKRCSSRSGGTDGPQGGPGLEVTTVTGRRERFQRAPTKSLRRGRVCGTSLLAGCRRRRRRRRAGIGMFGALFRGVDSWVEAMVGGWDGGIDSLECVWMGVDGRG